MMRGRVYNFVLYFAFLCCFSERIYCVNYPTVFWTPYNCRFNQNKPNAESEPYSFKVKPFNNNVFFTCPSIAIWQDLSRKNADLGLMYENLIMVDEAGYKNCSVGNRSSQYHNKELLRCNAPQKNKHFHERFTNTRADMNRIKYQYGRDYYFISTSRGTLESLNNTEGGHCKTHHMKLHIYVCNKTEPCEFKMPKCPFTDVFGSSGVSAERPTSPSEGKENGKENVTIKPPRELGRGSPRFLSETTHMVIHGVSGVILLILVITLVCVVCIKRKTKATMKCESIPAVDLKDPTGAPV